LLPSRGERRPGQGEGAARVISTTSPRPAMVRPGSRSSAGG